MDVEGVVVDALAQLGIGSRPGAGGPDRGVDVLIDPEGVATPVKVKRRWLVTDDVASRLLDEAAPGAVLLIVGDRVTEQARKLIIARRAGYLDLRGRLAIRTSTVLIDAEIDAISVRGGRVDPLSGKAGLEVAAALLMDPQHARGVRELARETGRAVGTVSEVLAGLRHDGLIDSSNLVTDVQLFWRVADRWATPRALLSQLPSEVDEASGRSLRLGLEAAPTGPGWALTDTAAALVYGAPVAFRPEQILDFFVPDQAVARRAATLLGVAGSVSNARAAVRVAPVPAAAARRVVLDANLFGWPLAHPLFVALDLAQDAGRGREILDGWTPDPRWTRVW